MGVATVRRLEAAETQIRGSGWIPSVWKIQQAFRRPPAWSSFRRRRGRVPASGLGRGEIAGVSPEAKSPKPRPLLLSHYVRCGRKCSRLKHRRARHCGAWVLNLGRRREGLARDFSEDPNVWKSDRLQSHGAQVSRVQFIRGFATWGATPGHPRRRQAEGDIPTIFLKRG